MFLEDLKVLFQQYIQEPIWEQEFNYYMCILYSIELMLKNHISINYHIVKEPQSKPQ